jgi:hypothetical protein
MLGSIMTAQSLSDRILRGGGQVRVNPDGSVTITPPAGGANVNGPGLALSTGPGGAGNTNGGDVAVTLGAGQGTGRNGQFGVGATGLTNPALLATLTGPGPATGIQLAANPAGAGVALTAISPAASENLTLDAKGGGTLTLNGTATGVVVVGHGLAVSGGPLTFAAANGPAGVNGAGVTLTTGAGGAGNTNGGDVTITLGAGAGTGRSGTFSVLGGGVGLGATASPGNTVYTSTSLSGGGTVNGLRVDAYFTNPAPNASQIGVYSYTNVTLTGANTATRVAAFYGQTNTASDANAYNLELDGAQFYVFYNGVSPGSAADLEAASAGAKTGPSASGTVASLVGGWWYAAPQGPGAITLAAGSKNLVEMSASGGPVDPQIANAYGAFGGLSLYGTATATPGVMTNAYTFFANSPYFGAPNVTATITNYYGLYVNLPANTLNHTSPSGGFSTYGAYLWVGNQGGNVSGTNTNVGLYIAGNGGTAAGGVVNNYAIYSASAAPSVFTGPLTGTLGLTISGGPVNLNVSSNSNVAIGTGTSTGVVAIGGNAAKVGFFGATAVGQPTATGDAHVLGTGNGAGVFASTTFDGSLGSLGYTIGDVVRALKSLGLLAS